MHRDLVFLLSALSLLNTITAEAKRDSTAEDLGSRN